MKIAGIVIEGFDVELHMQGEGRSARLSWRGPHSDTLNIFLRPPDVTSSAPADPTLMAMEDEGGLEFTLKYLYVEPGYDPNRVY